MRAPLGTRARRAALAGAIAAAVLAVTARPAAAQQRDSTGASGAGADSARADSARAGRAQALAPTVVTGTRLTDVDERTPVQVDQVRVRDVAPGPAAAAAALAKLPGVSVFDDQGTRVQPTVDIRGFTLSPVVGVPQGVSVFLDGVRINEPDAQQVNFDLIPMEAVSRAELVRGPATLFGKNTLAGALVLFTRRGDSTASAGVDVDGGAYGYRGARITASGMRGGIDGFLMAHGSEEDGWRDQTPARTRMLFANIGRKRDSTDVALTVMYAHDRLMQAGSLPESWFHVDPRANFTGGDFFEPELWHLALRGERPLGGGTIRGNVFHRRNDTQQFNVNIDAPSTDAFVASRSTGGTAEWTRPTTVGALPLALTVGAEYARNDVRYRIFSEATPEAPIDGSCDPSTGLCESARVNEDDGALYAQGVLQATPRLSFTAAARGDWVRVPFRDLRDPSNDGTNTFTRFSPRIGVNYTLSDAVRGYAAVSTGFRAPAALELACADASAPCPLPFSLGDDPPLRPVTVTNYETGFDWEPRDGANLDVVAYREDVRDEIVFVTSAATTTGFFQNIPRTRRQGIEASGSLSLPAGLRLFGSYALLGATYQSAVLLESALPAPDSARPGDEFPLSPRHRGSVGVEATRVVGRALLGAELSVRMVSSQFLRGNDANLERVALDSARTASGRIPGYSTTSLALRWERERVAIHASVSNLFDQRYATFGIFGENPKGAIGAPRPGEPVLERFLNPAYPRSVTLSMELRY
ncbi:MAG TPA: TonB-dependent receptor [Gemmatimonadaceae bacterium]|nr:TonB-dependent receptor [Gemmatimonadaceae bacterium]